MREDVKEKKQVRHELPPNKLLDFIQQSHEYDFPSYLQWLHECPNKPEALTFTLKTINKARNDHTSKIFTEDFSPKKLRFFTIVIIEQLSASLKVTPLAAKNFDNFSSALLFIEELVALLTEMESQPFGQVSAARLMPLGNLLSNIAAVCKTCDLFSLRDVRFSLDLTQLLHLWLHYDRETLTPMALSQALESMGSLAQHKILINKKISLNALIEHIEPKLAKQNLTVVKQWLMGLGMLAEKDLLLNPLMANHLNKVLGLFASLDFKDSDRANKAYLGFVKILKAWMVADISRIKINFLHDIFSKFFGSDFSLLAPIAYMTCNMSATKDYIPSVIISAETFHVIFNKLVDQVQSLASLRHKEENKGQLLGQLHLVCQIVLMLGQLVRFQPELYRTITSKVAESFEEVLSFVANTAAKVDVLISETFQKAHRSRGESSPAEIKNVINIQKKEKEAVKNELIGYLVDILYGRSLFGISNPSPASIRLRTLMSPFLERQADLETAKNIEILISKFVFFLYLNRQKTPKALSAVLSRNKPGQPTPGSFQDQVLQYISKHSTHIALAEVMVGDYFPVDIICKNIVIEINGWGHHFNHPIKGNTKDFLKCCILEFINEYSVHYFDFTKRAYTPKEIGDAVIKALNQAKLKQKGKTEKPKQVLQLFEYIGQKLKGNSQLWEASIADGKTAITADVKQSAAPKGKEEPQFEYKPIDIEEVKRPPKNKPLVSQVSDIPTSGQIMEAAIAGDIAKIRQFFNGKTPIHPVSGQPDRDRHIFTVALMMALQALHELRPEKNNLKDDIDPKVNNLRDVILFLITDTNINKNSLINSFMTEEGHEVSPAILVKKWGIGYAELHRHVQKGRSKKKSKIDWDAIKAKAEQLDDTISFKYLLLLKAIHPQVKESKDSLPDTGPSQVLVTSGAVFAPRAEDKGKLFPFSPTTLTSAELIDESKHKRSKCDEIYYFSKQNKKDIISTVVENFNLISAHASQGDALAQALLGCAYINANGSKDGVFSTENLIFADQKMGHYWLTMAAKQGNRDGQNYLGYYFATAKPPNLAESRKWFDLAVEQGHFQAQFFIGKYHCGKEDSAEAVYWYTKAAKQGFGDAQYKLGLIYYSGSAEVNRDLELAKKWLRQAKNEGVQEATLELAMIEHQDQLIPKISKIINKLNKQERNNAAPMLYLEALELIKKDRKKHAKKIEKDLKKSADRGSGWAQFTLGYLYYSSDFIPQNISKAIHYLKLTCGEMTKFAQYALGIIYQKDGPHYSIEEAIQYLNKSAEQNVKGALIELSRIYLREESYDLRKAYELILKATGPGNKDDISSCGKQLELIADLDFFKDIVQEHGIIFAEVMFRVGEPCIIRDTPAYNLEKAIAYFKKADQYDHPGAQICLGQIHENKGEVDKAIEYYQKAAKTQVAGLFYLGCIYKKESPQFDPSKAVQILTNAAELKHAPSQHTLGTLYQKGLKGGVEKRGVEKSDKMAVYYFELATQQKYQPSCFELAYIYDKKAKDVIKDIKNVKEAMKYYELAIRSKTQNPMQLTTLETRADSKQKMSTLRSQLMKVGGIAPLEPETQEWKIKAHKKLARLYRLQGPSGYFNAKNNYKIAAECGDKEAQFTLGNLYSQGLALGPNESKDLCWGWYQKAADQNLPEANLMLGSYYYNKREDEKAFRFFKLAAEAGLKEGKYQLALMYSSGDGVKQDFVKAREWCKAAIKQGDKEAEFLMSEILEKEKLHQDYPSQKMASRLFAIVTPKRENKPLTPELKKTVSIPTVVAPTKVNDKSLTVNIDSLTSEELFNFAQVLVKLKNYKEAFECYERVLKKSPGNKATALFHYASLQLKVAGSDTVRIQQALKNFEEAESLNPKNLAIKKKIKFCQQELARLIPEIKKHGSKQDAQKSDDRVSSDSVSFSNLAKNLNQGDRSISGQIDTFGLLGSGSSGKRKESSLSDKRTDMPEETLKV